MRFRYLAEFRMFQENYPARTDKYDFELDVNKPHKQMDDEALEKVEEYAKQEVKKKGYDSHITENVYRFGPGHEVHIAYSSR